MLTMSNFYSKLLEAAESCAAIGGVYIKIAWDQEISDYPIPVIEQCDNAYPEFKFGILTKVDFVSVVREESKRVVYRLVETYLNDGSIEYNLFKGTPKHIGKIVPLESISETEDLEDNIETATDNILCAYIPNIKPNRYNRNSYHGRSDFQGIEPLMDSLDEIYSSWVKDITIAQGRIHVPKGYLSRNESGNFKYNIDDMVYTEMDFDPTEKTNAITATQFDIRATDFEKSSLNFIERIVSSAGYSPQSFGISIEGRAESGTALNIRERKSFFTKNKKQLYWHSAVNHIIEMMILVYKEKLSGDIDPNYTTTVEFGDSIANDTDEKTTAVEKVARAMAASTETKVRWLHPDWSEDQVQAETLKIIKENAIGALVNPDDTSNLDI